jgi:hypothetical protein
LDSTSAQDVKSYTVSTWAIKRSAKYGSSQTNKKTLNVKSARLVSDRETVFLELPEIQPTQCMEIKISIRGADGVLIDRKIQNTVHSL